MDFRQGCAHTAFQNKHPAQPHMIPERRRQFALKWFRLQIFTGVGQQICCILKPGLGTGERLFQQQRDRIVMKDKLMKSDDQRSVFNSESGHLNLLNA